MPLGPPTNYLQRMSAPALFRRDLDAPPLSLFSPPKSPSLAFRAAAVCQEASYELDSVAYCSPQPSQSPLELSFNLPPTQRAVFCLSTARDPSLSQYHSSTSSSAHSRSVSAAHQSLQCPLPPRPLPTRSRVVPLIQHSSIARRTLTAVQVRARARTGR
jgi:hypothetical protein